MTACELASKSVRFSNGGSRLCGKDLEEPRRIALLDQEIDRPQALRRTVIGRTAEQRQGSIAEPDKFGAGKYSRAPKISAQDQHEVGGLRRLGVDQEAS